MTQFANQNWRYRQALSCLTAASDHPSRSELASEVHARPFLQIAAPARVTHLALFDGQPARDPNLHFQLAKDFCAAIDIAPPELGARHLSFSADGLQVKWERHTEFSTLTLVGASGGGEPFAHWHEASPVPMAEWHSRLSGLCLGALQIEVLQGAAGQAARAHRHDWFAAGSLVGSRVLGGGEVWCDWQVGKDGFSRILVLDLDFRENQVGRLVQRLAEIETYRLMALLALPIARDMLGKLENLDAALGHVMQRMTSEQAGGDDTDLLLNLTQLAGQVEALSAGANRFSAAKAYHQLVLARIHELREERIEGVPTIGEFMERRLLPAMDTCRTVQQRQSDLAERISRAIDLLRTRVNLVQERQITELLRGMNQTASTQLKLQHAVEGLSVVAISYYGISLIGHVLEALHDGGLHFNARVVEAALIPLIMGVTFLMIRGVRRRIVKTTDSKLPTPSS